MHTFKIHYDGHFIHAPVFEYVGGKVAHFPDIDPDLMSYFEILSYLRKINVDENFPKYYKISGFDLLHGLRLLNSDRMS